MPSICLSADIVTLDGEAAALVADAEEGTFLRLQVSDNGAGMDETTRQRIFDPFFTTKAIGQGTGLGLSTVYGTARLHGGWVSCESAPGQGATFALYFPPAPDAPCQAEAPPPESAATGGETVLVVDDEESVRTILSRGLSAHGYATMQATNGREGLEILQRHHIDLILLDLSMPLVSGHDVLAELHKTDSSAKVIVCTGYAAARDQFAGVADVLQKPIGLTELVRKVRRALDTPQP